MQNFFAYQRESLQILVLILLALTVASQDLDEWEAEHLGIWKVPETTWLATYWRYLVSVIVIYVLLVVLFLFFYRRVRGLEVTVADVGMTPLVRAGDRVVDMTLAIRPMLESFPTLTFSSDGEVGRGDILCPICRVDFTQRESIVSLPACSHVYHRDCLDGFWSFSRQARCPYCRHDYMSVATVSSD